MTIAFDNLALVKQLEHDDAFSRDQAETLAESLHETVFGDMATVSSLKETENTLRGVVKDTENTLRAGGALSGVVFYADGSGISSVKGTTDGKTLKWTQTSVSGHGPSGEVTGTISGEGALSLNKTGTTCNLTATLPMYNDVTARGG